MTHPNSIMRDFGKAFSAPRKRKTLSVEQIAEKILAFDPHNNANFVAIGIIVPMEPSSTGLTWEDVQALALHVTKGKRPKKRIAGVGRIMTF